MGSVNGDDGGSVRKRLVPYDSSDDEVSGIVIDDSDGASDCEGGEGRVVAPANPEPARYRFPQSWGRGELQYRGNYLYSKYHFGLRQVEWTLLRPRLFDGILDVLRSKDNRHVMNLAEATINNVESCCRMFYSFMVKVLGYSKLRLSLSHLIDPCLLNKWWVFCATPTAKGGRGSSRDTMRLLCNSMTHLHIACRALNVPPLHNNGPCAKACNRYVLSNALRAYALIPYWSESNALGSYTLILVRTVITGLALMHDGHTHYAQFCAGGGRSACNRCAGAARLGQGKIARKEMGDCGGGSWLSSMTSWRQASRRQGVCATGRGRGCRTMMVLATGAGTAWRNWSGLYKTCRSRP